MRTERQQDFLDAAISIVAEQGFSKLTIRNVAASVGVTEPAVYRHFASKLALVTAMLEDLQAAVLPLLRKLGEGSDDLVGTLEQFVHPLFDELKKRPAFAPFIFSEEVFHNESELKPMLYRVMGENLSALNRSIQILQEREVCRSDIPSKSLALVILGTIRLTISTWHIGTGNGSSETSRLHEQKNQIIQTFSTLLRYPDQKT